MGRGGRMIFFTVALTILVIAALNYAGGRLSKEIIVELLTVIVVPILVLVLLWMLIVKETTPATTTGGLSSLDVRLEGFMGEREKLQARAMELGIPFVDLARVNPDPEANDSLSRELQLKYQMLPIKKAGGCLWLAMIDVNNIRAQDDARYASGCKIVPVMCDPDELKVKLSEL